MLRLAAGATAALAVGGHTPYAQWRVYRKRFLLVLTTRADQLSFSVGRRLAAVLAARLPESRARVSRAPHKARVASLIATGQLDLAMMRPDDAAALRWGTRPFADYGPVRLRTLIATGGFLLVCRADFPARHAWRIAGALSGAADALPAPFAPVKPGTAPPDPRVPLHEGAAAYFAGDAIPAEEPQDGPFRTHDHDGQP